MKRLTTVVAAVMMFSTVAAIAGGGVKVLQGTGVTAAASMYSAKEARDKNYGGRLVISRANVFYQALLKFKLAGLTQTKVKDAAILLYSTRQYHNRPMVIEVFRVTSDWNEDEVTYNDCRKGVRWNTAGGDRDELPVARFELDAKFINGWVAVKDSKLTALLNQWLDKSKPDYGVLLRCAYKYRGQCMKFFAAGDKAAADTLPKLVISYDGVINPADFGVVDVAEAVKTTLRDDLKAIVKPEVTDVMPGFQGKIKVLQRRIDGLKADDKVAENVIAAEIDKLRCAVLGRLYPGKAVKLWRLGPWSKLGMTQLPGADAPLMEGTMLKNEYMEFSAGITNVTGREQTCEVTLKSGTSGLPDDAVQLRVSYWVSGILPKEYQQPGKSLFRWFDDALPRLTQGKYAVLAPGENRRLWLTVNSAGLKPGDYNFSIEVKPLNGTAEAVPVKLRVLPVALEPAPELHVYTYAYLNRTSTASFRKTAIEDLQAHCQNTFVMNLLPKYDPATGKTDFSAIEEYVRFLPRDAKKIMFFWNCESGKVPFCPAQSWGTEAWKKTLKKVVLEWYAVMAKAGFPAERVVMYPFDETYDNKCCGRTEYQALAEVAAELRTANPGIQVFCDPVAFRAQDIKEMEKLADNIAVWAPLQNLYESGDAGWPHHCSYADKLEARKFFSAEQKRGKYLWTYKCSGPSKFMDVNSYYRQIAWRAWLFNITGLGLWSYNDIRGGSGWSDADKGDFSLIYELRDAPSRIPAEPYEPLIPSRRWQMWRTGVQDYLLLRQAAAKVGREKIELIVNKVLETTENPDAFAAARKELQEILVR